MTYALRMGLTDMWMPPDRRFENVHDYVAARQRAYWGDDAHEQVAHTTIAYAVASGWMNVEVSTVFLMIDHSMGFGPPVLWETMVFGWPGDDDLMERDVDRYRTAEDATRGHKEMVSLTELALSLNNYPALATVTAQCRWWKA